MTLFAFLAIQGYHFAQIQIVDSLNSKPIPFAQIHIIEKNKKLPSTHDGYFMLDTLISKNDSIIVSSLGFETKKYAIKDIHSSKKITLNPDQQNFTEIVISQKKGKVKKRKLGVTKKPRKLVFNYGVSSLNGTIQAVYIPNKYSTQGLLKQVKVYITDHGIPNAYFRVHVYDVSLIEIKPTKELTSSNIVVSSAKGDEWLQVELSNERITIGENGCFVGIERFEYKDSKEFKDTLNIKTTVEDGNKRKDTSYTIIKSGNGIVLGARSEPYKLSKNKIWYKLPFSDEWVKWSEFKAKYELEIPDTLYSHYLQEVERINHSVEVPCINITASFSKLKAELSDMDLRNRKLNQLERVKEDLSEFPQSSVVELFNSLIKAFQNDDIIYAMKYLCVYRNDELESILTKLEEYKTRTGNYFSEKEKKQIIKHFNDLLESISEDSLIKIDSQHFEIKVGETSCSVYVINGKWKIQPFSFN